MIKNTKAKWIVRTLLLVGTVVSMFFVPWILVKAWILPLPDTIQEQVDEAIGYGFDGMIVYVDQTGKPPAYYTGGWKDREKKIPADPKSLFKIASISKLYTSVAATKLVKEKRLSFDKTLTDYLPELRGRIENAEIITLRMMLQHRSGIPNFTDEEYGYPWGETPMSTWKTLELVLDMPADFKPNKKYEYSNTNYLLIGEILDRTLGYSHHQYIKEEILIPLELNDTYSLLSEINLDDLTSGYHIGWDMDVKQNNYIIPGGSMIATIKDVGVFLRALIDGSLLNKQEQEIYSSIYKYEHTGLLPGYQSIARYNEDIDAVVILFINTSGNSWSKTESVYKKIVKAIKRES